MVKTEKGSCKAFVKWNGPLVGYCKYDFPTPIVSSEIADSMTRYTCEHLEDEESWP